MKTLITRAFSIIFALVMVLGLMAPVSMITASASGAENTDTQSVTYKKLDLSGTNFYMVKNKAVLRSSTGLIYTKLATFEKSSLIETSGTYDGFYKVVIKMNGKNTVGYIKKDELKGYVSTYNAKFCYTNKNAALRQAPYEDGDKITNIPKGNVLYTVSTMTNGYKNTWVGVYYQNHIRYMFIDNIKRTDKITVSVSGPEFIKTGSTTNFKVTVSPSAITGLTVTSSNTKLATVTNTGTVTPKAGGDVTITASLDGVVSASVNTNISLGVKAYFQTKNYTCSAASAAAVIRYLGKGNYSDNFLYGSINGYVYLIRDSLNKYVGKNTYRYDTFTDINKYEKAIRTSLAQNCPVVVRISFPSKYFNYKSNGHYSTVAGVYTKDNGEVWAILVDSFVNRYKSNAYSNAETGEVHVPLKELYYYNSYEGRDSRYIIYNN